MKKVIVLVGPTASGKTANSIYLAEQINGEIINGDSVQIYKELNIGSAKIKESEKEGIKHYLFDVLSAKESYTAYNFQNDVRKLINEINTPIIVGGTGFYIKSALYDYEFNDEENIDVQTFDSLSNEEIYQELIKLDSKLDIDINNRVRLVRAYNLALSGNLRSEKRKKNEPLYDILTIYLDADRKVLKEILVDRLNIMIEDGFIEEVQSLRNENIHLNTIGYRELNQFLNGEITLDEAKQLIIRASVKLAKRQKTWFLNQMDAISVNPYDNDVKDQILKIALEFLKK